MNRNKTYLPIFKVNIAQFIHGEKVTRSEESITFPEDVPQYFLAICFLIHVAIKGTTWIIVEYFAHKFSSIAGTAANAKRIRLPVWFFRFRIHFYQGDWIEHIEHA